MENQETNNNIQINNTNNQISPTQNARRSTTNEKRLCLVRAVCDNGMSIRNAAETYDIPYVNARKIINSFKKNGLINKKKKGGSLPAKLSQSLIDKIETIVSINPLYSLKQIKDELMLEQLNGFSISLSTINRALRKLKITVKKIHLELDRVNSPKKILQRKEYALWFNNNHISDYSNIVFVDESSFNLHIRRTRGRSRVGLRVNIVVPTVRGRSISLICSISAVGLVYSKVIAHSTVNSDIFSTYLEEMCNYLKNNLNREGVCIILDNARIHREAEILRITNSYGYSYKFLSPYSYMLNPIENAFSKIKNEVRSQL
ncbi:hypothetical protein CDIK_4330, partial [Cucumispora dikerogammari]